jgi:hypothetical protein
VRALVAAAQHRAAAAGQDRLRSRAASAVAAPRGVLARASCGGRFVIDGVCSLLLAGRGQGRLILVGMQVGHVMVHPTDEKVAAPLAA